MHTVTALAKYLGVTPATIRRWSSEFGDYLSPHASPPKGETRIYSDDDAAALALVATMRHANADYQNIIASLAAGDRGQWSPESNQRPQDAPGQAETGEGSSFPLVVQLTAKAANLEGELTATKAELDRRIDELKEAQTAAQSAEIRAAIAESKLADLLAQSDDKTLAAGEISGAAEPLTPAPGSAPAPTIKLTRWQKIRRRVRGQG